MGVPLIQNRDRNGISTTHSFVHAVPTGKENGCQWGKVHRQDEVKNAADPGVCPSPKSYEVQARLDVASLPHGKCFSQ